MVDGDFAFVLDGVDHADVEGNQGDAHQGDADQLLCGLGEPFPPVLTLQNLFAGHNGCPCHASTSF